MVPFQHPWQEDRSQEPGARAGEEQEPRVAVRLFSVGHGDGNGFDGGDGKVLGRARRARRIAVVPRQSRRVARMETRSH